jgi:hypothetical protein
VGAGRAALERTYPVLSPDPSSGWVTGPGGSDLSLVDRGGHPDRGEVVGDGQLRAGGDEVALQPGVDDDGAVGGCPDDSGRPPEAASDLDAADRVVLVHDAALGGVPVDEGAVGRRAENDRVAVDPRLVGGDVGTLTEQVLHRPDAADRDADERNEDQRPAGCGAQRPGPLPGVYRPSSP